MFRTLKLPLAQYRLWTLPPPQTSAIVRIHTHPRQSGASVLQCRVAQRVAPPPVQAKAKAIYRNSTEGKAKEVSDIEPHPHSPSFKLPGRVQASAIVRIHTHPRQNGGPE